MCYSFSNVFFSLQIVLTFNAVSEFSAVAKASYPIDTLRPFYCEYFSSKRSFSIITFLAIAMLESTPESNFHFTDDRFGLRKINLLNVIQIIN